MQYSGMRRRAILMSVAFSFIVIQSAMADGVKRGFGHFRPLNESTLGVQGKTSDRYAGDKIRPNVRYRYRPVPDDAKNRYAMPRASGQQVTPRFNRRTGEDAIPWSGGQQMPIPAQGITGNPVVKPEQIHPGYRFRPQEKAR
jgi:hypothetical protein